jgi:hypothetical protein
MSSSVKPSSVPGPVAARTLRTPDDLIGAGLAPASARAGLLAVAGQYATAIPPAFAALIEQPDDPIGLQVVPTPEELVVAPAERSDPIGDDALSPVPGIVHRYADRALLKPLLVCPLYCRFCFRREHVGPDGGVLDEAALAGALDWLRTHPQIREVILTGGRSTDALRPAAGRDRIGPVSYGARYYHPRAYACAGGGARAGDGCHAGCAGDRKSHVDGRAHQPCAGTFGGGAGQPAADCPARYSPAGAVGAAARRQ